ncbi:MAG: hypothetical protein QOH57_3689 [Mycobacterium sp.]|jgi:AcrR family transcriptional regulator|nr:hypothetical protein [Mycobacterium sp.]
MISSGATTTPVPAATRLLAAAHELFYREGVHDVGIDRLIEHAGVAKMSLYRSFGSKENLIAAYLDERHRMILHRLSDAVDREKDPRSRVLAVFDVQARWIKHRDYHGCAFTRATSEKTCGDETRAAVSRYRLAIRELLVHLADEVGANDPQQLGLQLFTLYQGSAVAHELPQQAKALRGVRTAVETLLDAATSAETR